MKVSKRLPPSEWRCFGRSFNDKNQKHMMRFKRRHPRHPHVSIFMCANPRCKRTIYYDMHREREVG